MFITSLLSGITQRCNQRYLSNHEPRYEDWIPSALDETGIPQRIYQICLRGNQEDAETVLQTLPDEVKNNIAHLKTNNPGWDYHLICDKEAENFISTAFGESILSYYRRIDKRYGSARADLLRYLLLYQNGGVYLDLKSTLDKSLSNNLLNNDKFLLFYWDNVKGGNRHCLIPNYIEQGEILQGFIISSPKHPFIRSVILQVLSCIDHYNPYLDGIGWTGVLNTTGPALYTKTIYNEVSLADTSQKKLYRAGRPFQDFGYKVNFYRDTTPGAYQKKLSFTDYRKQSVPVVIHPNALIDRINRTYLRIMTSFKNR